MAEAIFQRVTIVGTGLLGASLGMALKANGLAGHVVGVGRAGSASAALALARGAVDSISSDAAAASAGSDLVVLCTALGQFPGLLRQIAPALAPGALVTDVGSTKQSVLRWAAEALPAGHFVGSHPMAGSEKRGPEHATADLYRNAVCVVCPPDRGAAPAGQEQMVARVSGLWQAVGMRTVLLDAATHDAWVARVSHVPHAVAACLMLAAQRQQPEALALAAGGFIDTTRVAAGDVEMWRDIFATTDRAAVSAMLEELAAMLLEFRRMLGSADSEGIAQLLEQAKRHRDAFAASRSSRPADGGAGRAAVSITNHGKGSD